MVASDSMYIYQHPNIMQPIERGGVHYNEERSHYLYIKGDTSAAAKLLDRDYGIKNRKTTTTRY